MACPACRARPLHEENPRGREEGADEQDRIGYLVVEAAVSNVEGKHEAALEAAMQTVGARLTSTSKIGWENALVAAHALGRIEVLHELVERIEQMPPGELPPRLRAHGLRFRAHLGDDPDQRFRTAAATFREYGVVLRAAEVQTEHAEWLAGQGRAAEAEPLLAEAREVFTRIGTAPWLARAEALDPGLAAVAAEAK